jgi:hypothetical protein
MVLPGSKYHFPAEMLELFNVVFRMLGFDSVGEVTNQVARGAVFRNVVDNPMIPRWNVLLGRARVSFLRHPTGHRY